MKWWRFVDEADKLVDDTEGHRCASGRAVRGAIGEGEEVRA